MTFAPSECFLLLLVYRFRQLAAVVVCICAVESLDLRRLPGSPVGDDVVLPQHDFSHSYRHHHYGNADLLT